jgi:hypothetical protein
LKEERYTHGSSPSERPEYGSAQTEESLNSARLSTLAVSLSLIERLSGPSTHINEEKPQNMKQLTGPAIFE